MAYGDGNTKFFHVFATERKRFNHIKGLFNDNGRWREKDFEIADINISTIAKEVVTTILKILNKKGELNGWNETFITLIPKVHDPKDPKDLCPFSLCNTCYKIVARAITNRLRPTHVTTIDHHQSAFLSGRLITNNVIIGFECMHWIRNNKRNKT